LSFGEKIIKSLEQAIKYKEGEKDLKTSKLILCENMVLEYKGYEGNVIWSEDDKCFHGKIQNLGSDKLLIYEGEDIDELEKDFKELVDECLELKII